MKFKRCITAICSSALVLGLSFLLYPQSPAVTDTKATHVDINSKYVAVCEYNKMSLVNYSGKVISNLEIKKEVLDVSAVSSDKVVVLCKDCIQLLRM